MIFLIIWLLLGFLGVIVSGFAATQAVMRWRDDDAGPFLAFAFGGLAVQHVFIAALAVRAMLTYAGAPISLGVVLITAGQACGTIPTAALAAFYLGWIRPWGRKKI